MWTETITSIKSHSGRNYNFIKIEDVTFTGKWRMFDMPKSSFVLKPFVTTDFSSAAEFEDWKFKHMNRHLRGCGYDYYTKLPLKKEYKNIIDVQVEAECTIRTPITIRIKGSRAWGLFLVGMMRLFLHMNMKPYGLHQSN